MSISGTHRTIVIPGNEDVVREICRQNEYFGYDVIVLTNEEHPYLLDYDVRVIKCEGEIVFAMHDVPNDFLYTISRGH